MVVLLTGYKQKNLRMIISAIPVCAVYLLTNMPYFL